MGGSGKTTLAEAVYNEISTTFDACCFVHNVREKCERQGKESLRNDLLSKLLNSVTCIDTPSIGSPLTQQRLENKRVIVVLDDVNDSDQIVDMGIKHFGRGSKIIVTSRDKQELENGGADKIHKVEMLSEKDSLRLFSTFAFKQLNPADEFLYLSYKFVKYAQGSPLALKVLGSLLYTRSREVWESEVVKLNEYAKPKISQVLERSFYGLDELEKKIFLDIAIFFKGGPKEKVEAFLRGYYKESAVSGISRLLDKCLIEIVYERIFMHDMLEDMGKDIEKASGNRKRLWSTEDVDQMLRYNKWADSVEGIKLNMSGFDNRWLRSSVFQNMHSLRLIYLYSWSKKQHEVQVDHIAYFPDEIRYLHWSFYPFKSLPSSFNPTNLILLNLSDGDILKQLWNEDHEDLVNLREIDVSGCKNLRKIPNLSRAIDLKFLNCRRCESLVELPSLDHLASLEKFDLSYCTSLRKIPNLSGPLNLKFLNCEGCESLVELPSLDHLASLEKFDLSYCKSLRKIIPSLSGALNLKSIKCLGCSSLVELPCLNHLASLKKLDLRSCFNLKKFPEVPNHIYKLDLSDSQIEEVPYSVEHLVRLKSLDMNGSKVQKVSSNISKLESLHHVDLSCCPITEFPEIPRNLTESLLSGTQIGEQASLSLDLNIALPSLDEIPKPDVPSPTLRFKGLQYLTISGCESLKLLSELPPYLRYLNATDCRLLEKVSFTDQNLYQLDSLYDDDDNDVFVMFFSNCFSLNQDSVDNIETVALLKIGSLAQTWVRENANNPKNKLICCFPGNKISENKFDGQSESCSLILKMCGGRRFLAFAICLVAGFRNIETVPSFICNYQLTAAGGEEFKSECQVDFRMPYILEGDHVFILFSQDTITIDKDYERGIISILHQISRQVHKKRDRRQI